MNEDEAWERFEAARDEQFKKSSALGSIDVIQSQLNKLTGDVEGMMQKIDKMSAEQNEAQPAPEAPAPGAEAAPEEAAGSGGEMEEGVDQMVDETGAPGETGTDMMPPTQPQDEVGGVPKMTDEDLDMLFGTGKKDEAEGAGEAAGEQQDATLAALQEAIAKATDAKVISDLAQMIVEYTGGGDSVGEAEVLPGVPDEAPITEVSDTQFEELTRSATEQPVSDNVQASQDAAKTNDVPGDSGTEVKSESPLPDEAPKGDVKSATGATDVAAGSEPGPTEGSGAFNESCDGKSEEFKESDEEKKDDEKEEKDEAPESKDEDADATEKAPEESVEISEEVTEETPEAEGGDLQVAVSDLLNMTFGEVVDMVKDVTETPADDANVFINEQGKESIPFTNCTPLKRSASIDDLIMQRESTMIGIDGKKYQFSKSVQNAKALEKLNKSLHTYGDVTGMKAGEVLSACKFMKSIGVRGVEEDNMDALDVIIRGLDTKVGGEMTNAFMKSAGIDLDQIYKSEEIKKSEQPAEGGKHIPTLTETGGTDIKKSTDVPDVPRAADAGKAYVTPGDMKAKLKSIDELMAGRMKG